MQACLCLLLYVLYKDTLQKLENLEQTLVRMEKFRKHNGQPVDLATLTPLLKDSKQLLLSLEDIASQAKALLKANMPAVVGAGQPAAASRTAMFDLFS